MDDSAKSRENKEKEKPNVDLSLVSIGQDATKEKESRASGGTRTRSIWGRKKEKPVLT